MARAPDEPSKASSPSHDVAVVVGSPGPQACNLRAGTFAVSRQSRLRAHDKDAPDRGQRFETCTLRQRSVWITERRVLLHVDKFLGLIFRALVTTSRPCSPRRPRASGFPLSPPASW